MDKELDKNNFFDIFVCLYFILEKLNKIEETLQKINEENKI